MRILRAHRPGTTPVGIATSVGAADEHLVLTDLNHIFDHVIGMRSMMIIASSSTCILDGRMVTPRGYYNHQER